MNKVYQFIHAFIDAYRAIFKCILRYLKATVNHGLHITSSFSFALHGFIDVNWAYSVDNRKSTYGYLVYLGNTLVFWKSRKQRIVVYSSTEVKHKALTDGITKIVQILSIL